MCIYEKDVLMEFVFVYPKWIECCSSNSISPSGHSRKPYDEIKSTSRKKFWFKKLFWVHGIQGGRVRGGIKQDPFRKISKYLIIKMQYVNQTKFGGKILLTII